MIKRSHIAAAHDVVMASISIVASLYLRLGDEFHLSYDFLLPATFLFTLVCAAVFSTMGLYKGVWRYASLQDLLNITKAVVVSTLVFLPLMFMLTRLEEFPRSVLVINALMLMVLLGGPRILYRIIKDKSITLGNFSNVVDTRIPVLLVGISDNAVSFLRESAKKGSSDYKVVGIVDADDSKIGRNIHGVEIYGNFNAIPTVVKQLRKIGKEPQRIILAKDHFDSSVIAQLLKMADQLGFSLAKLPRMSDFDNNVDNIEIKPVSLEDLLGRPQKRPNVGRREDMVKGKRILVTGAGGTIGGELTRQIAGYDPECLILCEISEFNLYKIDKELEELGPDVPKFSLIGDIRDCAFLDNLFVRYNPDIVFHAAALKHVPIVENNLIEAVQTNIVGSKNIADMCVKYGVKRMVMISTDKAVNPTSLMGVTKRVAECYVQALGESKKNMCTVFSTVRFGNVLGSSGSVIPLFQRQLERGGPITVTHPDMVRYFMTVPEAVELVLQASTLNANEQESASVYVLDMGEPMRIKDLALQMIKLAGLRPEVDIGIKYTGIRKGEKLYEELFYEHEEKETTLYEGITYARAVPPKYKDLSSMVSALQFSIKGRDEKQISRILVGAVPEYAPNPDSDIVKDAA